MHYNFHRHYDPATGRYLTPDPIGLKGGINLFVYAQTNPISSIDALGLMGARPDDAIPSQAQSLGQVLAVDCISKRCKQGGGPLPYLKAYEICLSSYEDFRRANPTDPALTDAALQVLGGVDAFIDSCAERCSKETSSQGFKEKCCNNDE